jgi:hypothetical protein
MERARKERHPERFDYLKTGSTKPPRWYLIVRSWLR